ncbi:MAG: NINE protein [Saprospiraceae bacterium]|nr:NINE protein [Saprospiraceae bacterium]
MKNKNVAALLAFIGGVFGIHRFYLGQIGLGIFYCILSMTALSVILGILDGIIFLTMDQEVFDAKYNRTRAQYVGDPRRRPDFERPRTRRGRTYQQRTRKSPVTHRRPAPERPQRPSRRKQVVKNNPFKQAGIKKFKDYEFELAIEDFEQALKISPQDVAIHFNIACAYSQIEKPAKAFEHVSQAVELGFNDFGKIDSHDALAYMRIQPQWDDFKANGYTLRMKLDAPKENMLDNDLLLEQLKKLNELKEKGLITEEEFVTQKKKLMK